MDCFTTEFLENKINRYKRKIVHKLINVLSYSNIETQSDLLCIALEFSPKSKKKDSIIISSEIFNLENPQRDINSNKVQNSYKTLNLNAERKISNDSMSNTDENNSIIKLSRVSSRVLESDKLLLRKYSSGESIDHDQVQGQIIKPILNDIISNIFSKIKEKEDYSFKVNILHKKSLNEVKAKSSSKIPFLLNHLKQNENDSENLDPNITNNNEIKIAQKLKNNNSKINIKNCPLKIHFNFDTNQIYSILEENKEKTLKDVLLEICNQNQLPYNNFDLYAVTEHTDTDIHAGDIKNTKFDDEEDDNEVENEIPIDIQLKYLLSNEIDVK
jgi:hypothetical protein